MLSTATISYSQSSFRYVGIPKNKYNLVLKEYYRATGSETKGSKCPAWLCGLEGK